MDMKKSILLFVAAAFGCGTALQAQDTVSVKQPAEVRVITTPKSQTVEIFGSETDSTFYFSSTLEADENAILKTKQHLSAQDFNFSLPLFGKEDPGAGWESRNSVDLAINFGFGICFPSALNDAAYEPMRQAWGLDFSMQLLSAEWHPWKNRDKFFLNFGLQDKSFKIRGNQMYVKGEDGVLGFEPVPGRPKWSALRIFSWDIGFGYSQHIGKHVSLRVGPIVNFNTGSRIKTKYWDEGDHKHKSKVKFGNQRLVTYELMGMLKIHNFGIYVKYNPCRLIDKAYGPDFNTWSVGFVL